MNTPILNMIKTIILVVCLNLSNEKQTPATLYPKKETWAQRNYSTIMTVLVSILLILLMALFISICFALNGKTEANTYYYHMGDL